MKVPFVNTAFAAITSVSEFKNGLSSVLGIIMSFAFLIGVVLVIGGAIKREDNPAGAKNAMIAGAIIAGSVGIMAIFFVIFGNAGAVMDAKF
jgi:hypothetical protein